MRRSADKISSIPVGIVKARPRWAKPISTNDNLAAQSKEPTGRGSNVEAQKNESKKGGI
ncbi:hypothetical protein BRAS3843_2760018 [Bradyrhizobium sp. STM 3843]|nr:hypothetical protein BRAS3843_2760018 [Bradyrhizobium sp. STM 3843]